MGYSNYFNLADNKNDFDPIFLGHVKFICKYAMEVKGMELTGFFNREGGLLEPLNLQKDITKDLIRIGGANNESCETFILASRNNKENNFELLSGLEINEKFEFCKTDRHPYDAVVKAILMAGEEHGYIRNWEFDGNKNDKEYKDAESLFEKAKLAFECYLCKREEGLDSFFPEDISEEIYEGILKDFSEGDLSDYRIRDDEQREEKTKKTTRRQ